MPRTRIAAVPSGASPSAHKEQPDTASFQPPQRRLPARLANYSVPDYNAVDLQVQAGTPIASVWRAYAARVHAPLRYSAFAHRYRDWLRARKSLPEISPGIPNYRPAEYSAAEEFWTGRADPASSILALTGFGCSLKVEHGLLTAFDTGTIRKFEPINHRISAVVFGPFGGTISTPAIQWCVTRDIPIITLDYHSNLISVSAPLSPSNIGVRRAQFGTDPLVIARAILLQKIGRGFQIGRLSKEAHATAAFQVRTASEIEHLHRIEARAAFDYWSRSQFPLKYHPRGWPASWTNFDGRISAVSHGPRHATHPVNAILNYAYSVAAGMCARSLFAAGFDPCIGYLHTDREGRYSLAYDLLELLRADIDNSVLPWIATQTWRRADFPVTPSGIVRVHPNLSRIIVQRTAAAIPPALVDKAAAWLADIVRDAALHSSPIPIPPNAAERRERR